MAYIHARGCGHAEARQQLAGYRGILQVGGYGAYKALVRKGAEGIVLVFCLAHVRRKFVDAYRKSPSPVAAAIIGLIGEVCPIKPTLTICRRTWQRELAAICGASLRPGNARPP